MNKFGSKLFEKLGESEISKEAMHVLEGGIDKAPTSVDVDPVPEVNKTNPYGDGSETRVFLDS